MSIRARSYLLCLMLPFIMGQYGYYVSMIGSSCTGPCLPILSQADFEGSGCTDTNGETCTEVNSPDTDCATSTSACPIGVEGAGLLSFRQEPDTSEEVYKVAFTARTTGVLTLDTVMHKVGETGSIILVFGFISAAGNFDCSVNSNGNQDRLQAFANDGTGSSVISSVSDGTAYNLRLLYDIANDDCRLLAGTNGPGSSNIGDQTANGATGGSIVGWGVDKPTSTSEYIWDDIELCDGDAGTLAGICGGN